MFKAFLLLCVALLYRFDTDSSNDKEISLKRLKRLKNVY